MQLTPEIKAQLAEQKKQCIFCKLISGEIEAKTVFENDATIAMLDINPILKGHTLFMLKEHYPLPAYISGDEFIHKFSLIPGLAGAIKKAVVRTGLNVFIAMGGAAGQQSPHFLIHFLPRERGDVFFNFMFKTGKETLDEKGAKMLTNNIPIMMGNHFKRNPASWHKGKGDMPNFLKGVVKDSKVLYEDEKVIALIANKNESAGKGHIILYSKTEEKYVENLSQEDSAHLFFTASFLSTAVFEGLGAHGSNIILKSGESDDNEGGKLAIHVLPRWGGDSLSYLNWDPKQPNYDLDSVKSKIKDNTWNVKFEGEKKETKKESKSEDDSTKPKTITDLKPKVKVIRSKKSVENRSKNPMDEITKAIEKIKN